MFSSLFSQEEMEKYIDEAFVALQKCHVIVWSLPQEVILFQYISSLAQGSGIGLTEAIHAGYKPLRESIDEAREICKERISDLSQREIKTPVIWLKDMEQLRRVFEDFDLVATKMLKDCHKYYSPPEEEQFVAIQIEREDEILR